MNLITCIQHGHHIACKAAGGLFVLWSALALMLAILTIRIVVAIRQGPR